MISQQLLMTDIWNFNTIFVWACYLMGSMFVPIRNQLPVECWLNLLILYIHIRAGVLRVSNSSQIDHRYVVFTSLSKLLDWSIKEGYRERLFSFVILVYFM